MNILVCIKQVLDPDLPARDFKIDEQAKEAVRGGANLVTNIFCENALETALQLREKSGEGSKVTALCYGPDDAEDSLRKALAMTVDEAVLVVRDSGTSKPDANGVAKILGAAIRHLGEFDLVLVGRESGDWGVGQTGGVLAEELGLPALGFVDSVEPGGSGLALRRQTDNGSETADAQTPCLALITNNEFNQPRIPKTRDVMMSYRKPLAKLSLGDLGLDGDEIAAGASGYEVVELYIPVKDVQCDFVEGDSTDEKVAAFAARVRDVVASVS